MRYALSFCYLNIRHDVCVIELACYDLYMVDRFVKCEQCAKNNTLLHITHKCIICILYIDRCFLGTYCI